MIIFVVVVIALVLGLVTVGRYIFGGNSSRADTESINNARDEFLTVNADRSVVMTIRGPIVGDDQFRSESIAVSPSERTYTIYKGYRDEIKSQSSLDNNTPAYEEFVYALDKAAITKPGKYTSDQASDLRGVCASGDVYEYALYDGDNRLQWYWTSTCKGSPGTLGASSAQLTELFSAQMPNVKLLYGSSGNRLSL
ncbi:MAG TPA: hypothetical protein VL362_00655 [Patescibacteria group bacterium]|jgi:hypothetical protein|nr:hypothetical protein [Patescibacteria group bacterium]